MLVSDEKDWLRSNQTPTNSHSVYFKSRSRVKSCTVIENLIFIHPSAGSCPTRSSPHFECLWSPWSTAPPASSKSVTPTRTSRCPLKSGLPVLASRTVRATASNQHTLAERLSLLMSKMNLMIFQKKNNFSGTFLFSGVIILNFILHNNLLTVV